MKNVPVLNLAVTAFLFLICIVVTTTGFIVPQECDLDNIYLWCRTHPVKFSDILGLILLWAGSAFNAYFWIAKRDGFEDRTWVNYAGIVAAGLGLILMWL